MKLGLIGKPLGHSFSREIHRFLIQEDYSYWELEEDKLEEFLKKRDFDGINVTIPYKKSVIPYLDEIDPAAKRIGAVNTIVHQEEKLKGYNTDYTGLMRMIQNHQMDLQGQSVAILGSGGASLAAIEAVNALGGTPVRVSRTKKYASLSYDELYEQGKEFTYLINATPVGMYPDVDEVPVDLDQLPNLRGVVDIIANPLRTKLVFTAEQKGIPACGGLEMLVGQALSADEYFLNQRMEDSLIEDCLKELYREKRNIVLIGMPSAGKSTVAQLLSEKKQQEVIEMDACIEEEIGMSIRDYFAKSGEEAFRNKESEMCARHRFDQGKIISCGGGVIKREENIRNLAYNGILIFIDRDVDKLFASDSRPLSQSKSDVENLYQERYEFYERYCDVRIENNSELSRVIEEIEKL